MVREKAAEKTAIVVVRDHIAAWIAEDDRFHLKDPEPGILFSSIGNKVHRGPARIADWLITGRYYFWGVDIPDDIFPDMIGPRVRDSLVGKLRESLLCYGYGTNIRLGEMDQRRIREKFRAEWHCPSTRGGSQGGTDARAVADGLRAFCFGYADFLDVNRYIPFAERLADEAKLFDRIRSQSDDEELLGSYYRFLCASIARGTEADSEFSMLLCDIGFWDEPSSVKGLVDALCDQFASDEAQRRYAASFKEITLREYERYRTSLVEYLGSVSPASKSQRLLISLCTLPQLYRAARGFAVNLKDDQKSLVGKTLREPGEVFEYRRLVCAGEGLLPEYAWHKANVVWNVFVCSVMGPSLCRPAPPSTKTQVVSSIVEGAVLDDAIVVGTPPVALYDISPGGERHRALRQFDLGTVSHPRPDGALVVLGRTGESLDAGARKELKQRMQECVREAFDARPAVLARFADLTSEALMRHPVWLRHGMGCKVVDPDASAELAEVLVITLGELDIGALPKGGRVISGKTAKAALNTVVDDFFSKPRSYSRSKFAELVGDYPLADGPEDRLCESRGARSVETRNLMGKQETREAVGGCVDELLVEFRQKLLEDMVEAATRFCDDYDMRVVFREVLADSIREGVQGPSFSVPEEMSEERLTTYVVGDIVDSALSRYEELCLSVGASDRSVSREHLVVRAEDGRAVVKSVSENSPSYVKRVVSGLPCYHLMGTPELQELMARKLVESGIVGSGDRARIKYTTDGGPFSLRREDIIHLGASTEVELH